MDQKTRSKIVRDLGDRNKKVADIAKKYGVGRSTVWMIASEEGLLRANMWTMAEVKFLRDNYVELGPKPIAEALGRSETSVRAKANSEGLRFRGRHARFRVIEGGAGG